MFKTLAYYVLYALLCVLTILEMLKQMICSMLPHSQQESSNACVQPCPDLADLKGIRFQMYKVSKQCMGGKRLVAKYPISGHFEDNQKREAAFSEMRPVAFWKSTPTDQLVGVVVPGVLFADPIFKKLHQLHWIEPLADTHWIPNMRCYQINPTGLDKMDEILTWWAQLSFFEKVKLCILE